MFGMFRHPVDSAQEFAKSATQTVTGFGRHAADSARGIVNFAQRHPKYTTLYLAGIIGLMTSEVAKAWVSTFSCEVNGQNKEIRLDNGLHPTQLAIDIHGTPSGKSHCADFVLGYLSSLADQVREQEMSKDVINIVLPTVGLRPHGDL